LDGSAGDESLRLLEQHLGIEPGRIARLMAESEVFAEICADYEECCARLQSLEQRGARADAKLHDYLEMRDQLERELERYLKGADLHRPRG